MLIVFTCSQGQSLGENYQLGFLGQSSAGQQLCPDNLSSIYHCCPCPPLTIVHEVAPISEPCFLEHLTGVDWLNPHASHELLPRCAGNHGPEALPQGSESRVKGLRATGGVKVILSKLNSRVVVGHTSVGQPLVGRLSDHSL